MKFKDFKVGDKVKQRYIYDTCIYNNMVATIKELVEFPYYPNGDYSVVETRRMATLVYENGDVVRKYDIDTDSYGLTSAYEKVID